MGKMNDSRSSYQRTWRARVGDHGPLIACACGCGATFRQFNYNGHARRYVAGHQHPPRQLPAECGCGCGRRGILTGGLVRLCYQRLWAWKRRNGR